MGLEPLRNAKNLQTISKQRQRVIKHKCLYQDSLKPIAELNGTGSVVSQFTYAGKANVPEYMVKDGVTYRLITDHLGSVRLVVNVSDGSVAQRLDYDEFGRVLADTNPGFQPFGFAGGLYDPLTGLVRFPARDYDPDTGRWTAKDPIGFGGGAGNFYVCANNDPVNRSDPSGLEGFWVSLAQNLNPFNPQGSFYKSSTSIGQAMGGMLALAYDAVTFNWDALDSDVEFIAAAQKDSVLGQTECGPGWAKWGTRVALGVSAGATAAASGVGAYEFVALGNQSINVGLRAGELYLETGGRTFFRLNPFGNSASLNPYARRPHYHRRPINRPAGPGEGIGRHRPWE